MLQTQMYTPYKSFFGAVTYLNKTSESDPDTYMEATTLLLLHNLGERDRYHCPLEKKKFFWKAN